MTVITRTARTPFLAASVIGGVIVLAVLAAGLAIAANPAFSAAEVHLVNAVGAGHSPLLDAVCTIIDFVLGTKGAAVVGVLLLAWALLVTGTWRGALRAGIILAVPWLVAEGIKFVVRRPRPAPSALDRLIVPSPFSYSFPSGHTAFAAALVCAVVLTLMAKRTSTVVLVTVIALGVLFVLFVAWSRVYLGVHYPTDVAAAMVVVPAVAIPVDRVTRRIPLFATANG